MKKNKKFPRDAALWMEFAVYDVKTAKWEHEGSIFTSSCYACQQAAEKAFKSLLLARDGKLPRVHSLDRLLSELHALNIDVTAVQNDAQLLDGYYISTRYPGQYGSPEGMYTKEDSAEAIRSAEHILEFVENETEKL